MNKILTGEKTYLMSVLVTHAHNRLAYCVTRCLAKHGIRVTCASDFPLAACFFSRYCTDHFTYPSPWKHPDQFVQKIIDEIEKRDIEVLMPVHHEGFILAKYKDTLDRHVLFPYPAYSKIDAVSDKARLIEIAAKAGVRIPKTITPRAIDQLEEAKSSLRFPVRIKLRRGHGGIGMSLVKEESDLIPAYQKTLHKFNISLQEEYPIIQEHIEGKEMYVGMLFNHGKLKAKFGHFKIRTYPAGHGSGTLSIQLEDPRATKTLHKLAKSLNWHGIISGSIIIEENTGTPYIIDINPRFWGPLFLAIISGVEFPYLLYQMAKSGDIKPASQYTKGLQARWLHGDLASLPGYIQRKDWNQTLGILTCRAPTDSWESHDPIPFFTLPIYNLIQLIHIGTMQPLIEKY